MASSRNSSSTEAGLHPLEERVRHELVEHVDPGDRVLLGYSGGRDSSSLLRVLARLSKELRFDLRAVHVHHGLSPRADEWGDFCARTCAVLGVPFSVERVDLSRHRAHGREGAARVARYEAYARHEADVLVLAHHADDQAETVMLRLLRGAGPGGLSGMRSCRVEPGVSWKKLLRPLLGIPGGEIAAYAGERGINWVTDESNDDTLLDRNFLRKRVLPVLEARFPGAHGRLGQSAVLAAEAGELLDVLGESDATALRVDSGFGAGLDLVGLKKLGSARGRNALRAWLRQLQAPSPGHDALVELWRQVTTARGDTQPFQEKDGWGIRRYRGVLLLERSRPLPMDFQLAWRGEDRLPIVPLGGTLVFEAEEGRGLSALKLRAAAVSVKLRCGGERLQTVAGGYHRSLKNLMQERGIPPWRRERWPLIYADDQLVCIPSVSDDPQWRAGPGEAGLIVSWQSL